VRTLSLTRNDGGASCKCELLIADKENRMRGACKGEGKVWAANLFQRPADGPHDAQRRLGEHDVGVCDEQHVDAEVIEQLPVCPHQTIAHGQGVPARIVAVRRVQQPARNAEAPCGAREGNPSVYV